MMDIIENVQLEVSRLIPEFLINDVACFVFYDNHPKDEKVIDIAICTKNGELREYFQRDLVSSIVLDCGTPTDIKIMRNNNSDLFYLVSTESSLYVISSKDNFLKIYKHITDVERYDISDTACSGQDYLRVFTKDDAVPQIFNSNLELQNDENEWIIQGNQVGPIIDKLQAKLVEGKYNTKCTEDTLREYMNIRQKVTLVTYHNLHPNMNDSTFRDSISNISGSLKIKASKPQLTICNNKILLILNVINQYEENLKDVSILLENKNLPCLIYTNRLFKKLDTSPYWREMNNTLLPGMESAIVAVLPIEEIKHNVISRIELAGSVSFKTSTKEYLQPFDDALLSSTKLMGEEFNVLSNLNADDNNTTILAILASTQNVDLQLRHIKSEDEPDTSIMELFCIYLHMEKIADNIIVYRKSPYHALNGVMIVFNEHPSTDKCLSVSVHTRSTSQVLNLLHCINDAVPSKILATTPNYKISAKIEELSEYSEEIPDTVCQKYNYKEYARSMLKRTMKILEYLDSCMSKMNESKNPAVLARVGRDIDLFAGGVENFKEFRSEIMDEGKKGIDMLFNSDSTEFSAESDVMVID